MSLPHSTSEDKKYTLAVSTVLAYSNFSLNHSILITLFYDFTTNTINNSYNHPSTQSSILTHFKPHYLILCNIMYIIYFI
jgi:hypothetical protein